MNRKVYSVEKMCKVLDVSPNAFYSWKRTKDKEPLGQHDLIVQIKEVFEWSRGSYGSHRMTEELKRRGYHYSRSWIARLMKQCGLKSNRARKFRATTDSKHRFEISPNLLERDFSADEIGKVWVSDITYIPLGYRFYYFTCILDLADRKIVGWSLSKTLTASDTIIKAWYHARSRRNIKDGFIFHSDRGVQYACKEFRKLLDSNKYIRQSMSRKGDCWDNAVAESFFKTLKYEALLDKQIDDFYLLKSFLFQWIEGWYHPHRLHSALGYKTPNEIEQKLLTKFANAA